MAHDLQLGQSSRHVSGQHAYLLVSGDTVYYGNDVSVSASYNLGSLTPGQYLDQPGPAYLVSAGTSYIRQVDRATVSDASIVRPIDGGVPTYDADKRTFKFESGFDVVNVRDYGATGDGTTDDTAAFQAAMDAAAPEGDVYVPAGEYRIATGLTLPPGVGFGGVGPGSKLIFDDHASNGVSITGDSGYGQATAAIVKGDTEVTVADSSLYEAGDMVIFITNNGDYGYFTTTVKSAAAGVVTVSEPIPYDWPITDTGPDPDVDLDPKIYKVTTVAGSNRIENLSFYGASGPLRTYFLNLYRFQNVSIENCEFFDLAADSAAVIEASGGIGLNVTNCTISRIGGGALAALPIEMYAVSMASITNNTIDRSSAGITFSGCANSSVTNNRIFGKAPSGGGSRGIKLLGSVNIICSGNIIQNLSLTGIHSNNTSDSVIDGNHIYQCGDNGGNSITISGEEITPLQMVVSNNVIKDSYDMGICVAPAPQGEPSRTVITGNIVDTIGLRGDANNRTGIYCGGTAGVVSNNIVRKWQSGGGSGIYSVGNTVSGNRGEHSGGTFIYSGGNNTILNNVTTGGTVVYQNNDQTGLVATGNDASSSAVNVRVSGDTQDRVRLRLDGTIFWGDGTDLDTAYLRRIAPNVVGYTGKFTADQGFGVGNSVSRTTLASPGTVTAMIEVFNASGISLGCIPVYNSGSFS